MYVLVQGIFFNLVILIISALSAPVNYRDFLRIAWFSRFDVLFGMADLAETADTSCPYLQFHDGGNSDANTDTDVRNMEGRLQMTLQEVKEHVFGSVSKNQVILMILQ